MEYLWTHKGNAPPEYIEMVLCRDVYHCTPAELEKQDWATVEIHLELLNQETEVRNMQRQAEINKAKAKRRRK
jgi:hypothetical protein